MYASTDEGRTFLKDWLLAPLEPLQLRHPLLLKLVFAADEEPAALDEVLARYAASLEESRTELAHRLTSREIFSLAHSLRQAEIWRLSIEHGLGWCEHEREWVKRARKRLSKTRVARRKPRSRKTANARE